MRILVDAMGGDLAPDEIVKGAVHAQQELGAEIVLVGQRAAIEACLRNEQAKLEIIDASEVITMDDDPSTATRRKKDASMTVALNMLRDGKGDAVVSAGSTGALLTGATLIVKRIHGIRRAALAPVLPNGDAGVMLIDCGANAECTPEYLLQFAYLGSYYAQRVMGIEKPRVGLLNIGAEPSKGTDLQRETYALLKKAGDEGRINFIGNIEAREAVEGAVDVIVSDGYSGNIFLKTMEGTGLFLAREIKKMFKKNLITKLSALLVSGGLKEFKKLMDSSEVGGTALVGISKPVIKAHGSSDAYAVQNAIRQAMTCHQNNMVGLIEEYMESYRAAEAAAKAEAAAGEAEAQ